MTDAATADLSFAAGFNRAELQPVCLWGICLVENRLQVGSGTTRWTEDRTINGHLHVVGDADASKGPANLYIQNGSRTYINGGDIAFGGGVLFGGVNVGFNDSRAAPGKLVVTGPKSELDLMTATDRTRGWRLQANSEGELLVENQGTVRIGSLVYRSKVRVTGEGSTIYANSVTSNRITTLPNAALNVENGGRLITNNANGAEQLTVSGKGSRWDNQNTIKYGNFTVTNEGLVDTRRLEGSATVPGPARS